MEILMRAKLNVAHGPEVAHPCFTLLSRCSQARKVETSVNAEAERGSIGARQQHELAEQP